MHDTDHILAELDETIAQLRVEKKRSRQLQADKEITDNYGDNADPQDMGEFNGEPFLLVPFSRGDVGDRPLARRPDGPAPLASVGLEVHRGGTPVEVIEPGETYEIRCRVRNAGDLDVPPAPIEFFVGHRQRTAAIDTVDGEVVLRPEANQPITGWTTGPPGKFIHLQVRQRGDTAWQKSRFVTIQPDRSFEWLVDLSGADPGADFEVEARYVPDPGAVSILLDQQPGRFGSGGPAEPAPLPLASPIADVDFLGVEHGRVVGKDEREVGLRYTAPPLVDDRMLTVIYARVYSLSPTDLPASLDVLDHARFRHVGRTELYWEGQWL